MTSDTLAARLPFWKDLIWLGGAIATASLFILSIFFAGIMAIWGEGIRVTSQAWLGVTEIKDELAEVTGRSRVIREQEGMAYVKEPVRIGEDIILVLFMSRTEVGVACILRQYVPLFMDDNGVTLSGEARPPVRQIGTDSDRLEVVLTPPARLGPGHSIVWLQLEYLCGERTVFDRTDPVDFTMLPAE